MLFPICVNAQNGGLNVNDISAGTSLLVGDQSGDHINITSQLVSLPPLSNDEIMMITDPEEGMLVYSSASDVLLVCDGTWWKRIDGTNDQFLIVDPPCEGFVYHDLDGNTFNGVEIGTQCWMDQNLKVTRYPNGEEIPNITVDSEWIALGNNNTDDAYCYYNNNAGSIYGALYTYAAAIADNWVRDNYDGQGVCPFGWHLPTDSEWSILTTFLGGESIAGGKMKSVGTTYWDSPNVGATNSSNFNGLPGGYRIFGYFRYSSDNSCWWSATVSTSGYSWRRSLYHNEESVYRWPISRSDGLSIRCLRNE